LRNASGEADEGEVREGLLDRGWDRSKGDEGNFNRRKEGFLIKVGEKTIQKDEYLIVLRSVVTRFGGPPHDECF